MSNNSTTSKVLVSLMALFLCGVIASASFVVGAVIGTSVLGGNQSDIVEVTREIVNEVEVTRLVEATDDSAPAAVEESTTEEAAAEAAVDNSVTAEEQEGRAATDADQDVAQEEEDPGTPLPDDLTAADLELFFEVWDNIEEDFDGEMPSREELNYAIIRGALETLDDDYTRFLTPELAEREREAMEGSFEGIGAFVRENDEGFIEIVRPIDGQPADTAGLESGDLIIGVDGEDVIGQGIDEVISKVRGPRGTEVILTIAREGEGEPLEIKITRARIEIPVLEAEILDDNIAYLHLTTFAAFDVDQTVEDTVAQLLAQNPQGFILDLRDNPGGFLEDSVNIADLFLPEGVVLYEKSANGVYNRTFESFDGDIAEEIPLVVLVNAGSASASELVSGALRDNGRAILIGETTFGKGSVQQLRDLSGGSELRVTIARWYTPENNNINGEGITPDIVIELNEDAALGDENDNQLQRAIEYILTGE